MSELNFYLPQTIEHRFRHTLSGRLVKGIISVYFITMQLMHIPFIMLKITNQGHISLQYFLHK